MNTDDAHLEMHQLESILIGAGAAHHGRHLIQSRRGGGQQDRPELCDPVVSRIDTQRGSVSQHGQRVRRGEYRQQSRVVVTLSSTFNSGWSHYKYLPRGTDDI